MASRVADVSDRQTGHLALLAKFIQTVWQWSMRSWFLIIAQEEAERSRERGREWRLGVVLQGSPLSVHLRPCAYVDLGFPPRWFISSFRSLDCWMYTKHMPVAMKMAADLNGGADTNIWTSFWTRIQRRPLRTCHRPSGWKQRWARLIFTARVESIEGIDTLMDWVSGGGGVNNLLLGQ